MRAAASRGRAELRHPGGIRGDDAPGVLLFRSPSGGLPSLDLRFKGVSESEGLAWIAALGRPGAEIILVWHYLPFDLILPALLSLTLVSPILKTGERLPRFTAMS